MELADAIRKRRAVRTYTDKPVDDEFLALARQAGTTYNPTLVVLDGYVTVAKAAAAGAPAPFEDPNGCADPASRAGPTTVRRAFER